MIDFPSMVLPLGISSKHGPLRQGAAQSDVMCGNCGGDLGGLLVLMRCIEDDSEPSCGNNRACPLHFDFVRFPTRSSGGYGLSLV